MSHFLTHLWLLIAYVAFFPAVLGALEQDEDKLAVPDADAQKTMVEIVRGTYADDFKSARSTEQKIAVARKLLNQGLATTDDTTGRYVLLQMATDMAAANGDMETAWRAIEQTQLKFQIDEVVVQVQTMGTAVSAVRSRDLQKLLLPRLDELLGKTIAADRYDLAKRTAELKLTAARNLRDPSIIRQATSKLSEVETLEKEFAAVQGAIATLDNSPADPRANLLAGRFNCFVKGDWESGLPMLSLSDDVLLKSLAEKELSTPTQVSEQVNLGDEWWTVAERESGQAKHNLLLHSRLWYERAVPNLSGLTQARVQKRLTELETLNPSRAKLPTGSVVAFDFERSSLNRRDGKLVLRDLSGQGGDGEIVNGALAEGVHGNAIRFQGDGYITFSDKRLPIGDAPRSILFWVKIEKLATAPVSFVYGLHQEGDATYVIVHTNDNEQMRASRISVGNPGGRGELAGKKIVMDGKWHHIALVYDGKGSVQLYVDGQLDLAFRRNYRTTAPGDAYIGSFQSVTNNWLIGAIDDFIIFDRAVSADEIKRIKDAGLFAK
jgi:hypothetical protein